MSQTARLNRRPRQEGENVARRRFQKGSVRRRGNVWIGRYLEDVLENGVLRRKHRTITLSLVRGADGKAVTERQAKRLLQPYLDRVNSTSNDFLQPKKTISFSDFSAKWKALILRHKKPSTQLTIQGHIQNLLLPALGHQEVRCIQTEGVQSLLSDLRTKLSPKTLRNVKATISMMWRIAKAWGYTEHDVASGLDLPSVARSKQPFFTAPQMRRIIAIAKEPEATFYWLAAETVWRGVVQSPKTESAFRAISISPQLADQLRSHLGTQATKHTEFLFSTRTGSPWDANLLVKRKLHCILRLLELPRCGLHAFRHGNATLMDSLGAPLKVKQYRLGHSRAGDITTDVYTHYQIGDDAPMAKKLGEALCSEASNSLPLTCPNQEGLPVAVREALVNKQEIGCGGWI